MADATNIKAWHRVADAGFGDIIMQHGFRKVGRSMWRRDGDGVQWRVALTKGYADEPNTFRVVYGGMVPGLAELVKSYDPKQTFERLPGTSVRRDAGGDLDLDMLYEQREAWEANHPYERKKGWRRFLQIAFEPPEEKFHLSYIEVPFCDLDHYASTFRAFDTSRGDISDIAETLGRAWVRLNLDWIEQRLDYPDLYADYWGPNSRNVRRSSNEDPEFYAAAKLAGDQDWINTMAEQVFREGRKTFDETRHEEIRRGPIIQNSRKLGPDECEVMYRNAHVAKLRAARTVICIAEAMQIDIPDHGIDFDSFGETLSPRRRA